MKLAVLNSVVDPDVCGSCTSFELTGIYLLVSTEFFKNSSGTNSVGDYVKITIGSCRSFCLPLCKDYSGKCYWVR